MSKSISPSPGPSSGPVNRHAPTAVEKQRMQLEKLLKDPLKPAYIPPPPKEKTIRPPREMMKNVQGSSAGAGSGEFHVYKASRRREYERTKLMEEKVEKEAVANAFEEKKRKMEEEADAKTAKNRAKRLKKKERSKAKGQDAGGQKEDEEDNGASFTKASNDAPLKKRRLVNGSELVFRKPGEEDEGDGDGDGEVGPQPIVEQDEASTADSLLPIAESKIVIHEED
ncbi:DUF1168-domain-containing protein [Schizopora paradoxa]|uniref:DUF1168-domain-containing protein n=1 Tax=Schizopora paradoxa TaxID=27342 RepID=A0A0H2RIT9_9AGAM|nr:DUF1168-domain-containing protein [Schizopora paradoxa]